MKRAGLANTETFQAPERKDVFKSEETKTFLYYVSEFAMAGARHNGEFGDIGLGRFRLLDAVVWTFWLPRHADLWCGPSESTIRENFYTFCHRHRVDSDIVGRLRDVLKDVSVTRTPEGGLSPNVVGMLSKIATEMPKI